MRFRYKKYIPMLLISTMGIGSITLAIPINPPVKEAIKYSNAQDEDEATATITPTMTPVPTGWVTPTPTPAISPTPTPLPVYPLEEDGYPEITELMKAYYDAKHKCDVDKLKELASDPSYIPSKEKLQEEIYFDEDFRNIKCYVKKGYREGTYFVYVYYDIKLYNIDTLLPTLKQFYIVTVDGKLKIYTPDYDEEINDYFAARKQDADVKELFDEVNKKYKKALKKDADLEAFCNGTN